MKSFLILILIVIKTFSLQSTSNPSLSGRLGGAGTLAFYYADKGEWSKTDSITNMMDTIYEKQNEAIVIEVYKALKQNGENIYSLVSDTLLQQQIMQVVNDSTRKGYAAAISILQQVFGRVYYEPINDDSEQDTRSMILANVTNKPISNTFILCFPNPSSDVINFKYFLPDDSNNGLIKIYDNIGKLIKSISLNSKEGIETFRFNSLSNGLYYYNLIVNNTTIARDKFVINK